MQRKLCELLEELKTLEKEKPTEENLTRKFEILSRIAFIQLLMSGTGVSALNSLMESCEQLDREASKLFSKPHPQKTREAYILEIDRWVRYIPLTPQENRRLSEISHVMERIAERVYVMLNKAEPIDREKFNKLDFALVTEILRAILDNECST